MKKAFFFFIFINLLLNVSNAQGFNHLESNTNNQFNNDNNNISHVNQSEITIQKIIDRINKRIIPNKEQTVLPYIKDKAFLLNKPYGKIIAYLDNGDKVKIIGEQNNHYIVRSEKGNGYVSNYNVNIELENISFIRETDIPTDIYDSNGKKIGFIDDCEEVEIIAVGKNLVKIKFNNEEGFIPIYAIFIEDESDEINKEEDDDDDEDDVDEEDDENEVIGVNESEVESEDELSDDDDDEDESPELITDLSKYEFKLTDEDYYNNLKSSLLKEIGKNQIFGTVEFKEQNKEKK